MKKQLEELQRPLTNKEKLKLAKKEYRDNFSIEADISSEFRSVEERESSLLDKKLKIKLRKLEKGQKLTEQEDKEFKRLLGLFLKDRKLTIDDIAETYKNTKVYNDKSRSPITTYIAEHADELRTEDVNYGSMNYFERMQYNLHDKEYIESKEKIHLEALKNSAENYLTNPNIKRFALSVTTERVILETVAMCLKSEDDDDKKRLARMLPHLEKISKSLINKDGKTVNEKALQELYQQKTDRVVKTTEEIANYGKTYSNQLYEETTSRMVATRAYQMHIETMMNEIIRSNMTEDEKREALLNLTTDMEINESRSKVVSLFVFGKINRSYSSSERYYSTMSTIVDKGDTYQIGTTGIAETPLKRNINEEKAQNLLEDETAKRDLSNNEKKLISDYVDNRIESENVEEAVKAAKEFTDFSTYGADIAKQIYMIKQAEICGPESTQRYVDEHPDYTSFLDGGSMGLSNSLLRARALEKLSTGLAEESPEIDNNAINLIMHSISFSSLFKNITSMALQYAEKFLSKEQIEDCLMTTPEGKTRVYDLKLLGLLEEKLRENPNISDEEKTKFAEGDYKARDVFEENLISREIQAEARQYLIESGIKEEDLPMIGEIEEEVEAQEKPSKDEEEAPIADEESKKTEDKKKESKQTKKAEEKEPEKSDAPEVEEASTEETEKTPIPDKEVTGLFVEGSVVLMGEDSIVPEKAINDAAIEKMDQHVIHIGEKQVVTEKVPETPDEEAPKKDANNKKNKQGGAEIETDEDLDRG